MLARLNSFVADCAAQMRRDRKRRRRANKSRPIFFEPLEERVLLATTLFLDFGLGIGMNETMTATVEPAEMGNVNCGMA